jgi:putative phage-type endonuclease
MRRVTPTGVMVMTAKEMQEDRPGWLRLRRFRDGIGYCIGSSDLPSILGIKDSGTPVKVWHEKVKGIEQPDNPHMMWGRLHEKTIAEHWRNVNKSAVRAIGLVAAVDRPWAQASLDRAVLLCPLTGEAGICALEIKTRGPFGSRRFHKDLPDDVLAQICWQLIVSGYDHIHYAILVGGNDYRQGVVRRTEDAATIAFVLRQVEAFRDSYLAGDFVPERDEEGKPTGLRVWQGREVEPPWDVQGRAASLIELDGIVHPERLDVKQVDDDDPVMGLAQARARLAVAAKAEKVAKATLLRQADGARYVTIPTDEGPELAYEFTPSDRSRVDLDILREKYPAAYADPQVVIHSTSWKIKIADAYKVKNQPEEEG